MLILVWPMSHRLSGDTRSRRWNFLIHVNQREGGGGKNVWTYFIAVAEEEQIRQLVVLEPVQWQRLAAGLFSSVEPRVCFVQCAACHASIHALSSRPCPDGDGFSD